MQHFKSAFAGHKYLIALSLLYMAAVSLAIFHEGGTPRRFWFIIATYTLASSLTLFFILGVFCVFTAQAAWAVRGLPPRRWLPGVIAGFEQRLDAYASSGMIQNAFWGVVALLPLLTFFSMAKSMIPEIAGFTWDPALSRIDRIVHFGHYPHEWLVPVVERLHIMWLFDDAYLVWFGVMFAANGFCLFCDRDTLRRRQYLWSFSLCWIVSGTVLAFVFASCGPVFYHLFYPDMPDPYAKLAIWLRTAKDGGPADTLLVADYLYGMVTDDIRPDLNGISAMPSQHVAIAWLIALYARRVDRRLGPPAFAYAIVIMLGSIVLGWHYGIDGYIGIAVVSLVWWLCGKALAKGY